MNLQVLNNQIKNEIEGKVTIKLLLDPAAGEELSGLVEKGKFVHFLEIYNQESGCYIWPTFCKSKKITKEKFDKLMSLIDEDGYYYDSDFMATLATINYKGYTAFFDEFYN